MSNFAIVFTVGLVIVAAVVALCVLLPKDDDQEWPQS